MGLSGLQGRNRPTIGRITLAHIWSVITIANATASSTSPAFFGPSFLKRKSINITYNGSHIHFPVMSVIRPSRNGVWFPLNSNRIWLSRDVIVSIMIVSCRINDWFVLSGCKYSHFFAIIHINIRFFYKKLTEHSAFQSRMLRVPLPLRVGGGWGEALKMRCSVETVCANLLLGQTDGLHKILKRVEFQ